MIKVIVNGASGKLGQVATSALRDDKDFELVAELGRKDDLGVAIAALSPHVVLDVTAASVARQNAELIIRSGSRPVIGTSGLLEGDLAALSEMLDQRGSGGLVVPNFSLSVALMLRFAAEAARYFPRAEILEYHHERKQDSPSGTALATAAAIDAAGAREPTTGGIELQPGARGARHGSVRIHSVRLPSLGAHQEVMFSSESEMLTLRSDVTSRDAYRQGIALACRRAVTLRGLHVGLEGLL
jgi:4-hydroxy-tetrahydrodipicolinate reductase